MEENNTSNFESFNNSIKATLYDRISSPLYSTLAISWCISNWKFLYFIISDTNYSASNRIDYACCFYLSVSHSIIYPLISTAIILGLYPLLSRYLFRWIHINKQKSVEFKNLNSSPLTRAQSFVVRKEMSEQTKKFDIIIEEKDLIIDELKKEITSLKATNKKTDQMNSSFKYWLDEHLDFFIGQKDWLLKILDSMKNNTAQVDESQTVSILEALKNQDGLEYQLRNTLAHIEKWEQNERKSVVK